MKKLLLFLAAGLSATAMNAQQLSELSPVFLANHNAKTPVENSKALVMPAKSNPATANKTTATADRWYSYFNEIDAFNSGSLSTGTNLRVIRSWFDTTIRQVFSSGAGTINYSGESIYIDPINFDLYNDPTLHPSMMKVTAGNSYTVDSVHFVAAYEQSLTRPNTVVDTLVVSVAPSTGRYHISKTTSAWANAYLPSNKDTLYAYTCLNVDSVNRCAFSDVNGTNRIMWKVPLTAAMRDTGFNLKDFTFKVPNGGLVVPAGNGFSVTCAFKSGDTWIKNVDTIDNFHRWMLLSSQNATNAIMPYYYYQLHDHNMSNMMFSFDTSSFYPSVLIEGWNTTAYSYEFHSIDALLKCPTCPTTGVNDINIFGSIMAYPNPANNDVTVKFTVKETADVSVSLINTLGQTMKVQNMGKVSGGQAAQANINVADLPTGVYFCTLEANSQRTTKRIVVTH